MNKKQKTIKKLAGQKVLFFMIIPYMIYSFIFSYYPLSGWIMAFQNYKPAKGYSGSTFVGLDQFMFLFKECAQYIGYVIDESGIQLCFCHCVCTFIE